MWAFRDDCIKENIVWYSLIHSKIYFANQGFRYFPNKFWKVIFAYFLIGVNNTRK